MGGATSFLLFQTLTVTTLFLVLTTPFILRDAAPPPRHHPRFPRSVTIPIRIRSS